MNRGYIKLFRCIEDNILWQSNEPFCKRAAWQDLILLANHEDNSFLLGNQKMIVKRGQHWTSIEKLANRWHWSEKKLRAFLDLLANENMIYLETTNRGSMITLVNYGKYQDFKSQKGTPREGLKEELKNIKGISEGRSKGRTKGTQTIMNKNDIKNDIKNESKNVKKPSALSDFFVED